MATALPPAIQSGDAQPTGSSWERAATPPPAADPGEESIIILQSLLCLLREKNMLTRADIEELSEMVQRRAAGTSRNPLPCCAEAAQGASGVMQRLTSYLGQRYGGKHARH